MLKSYLSLLSKSIHIWRELHAEKAVSNPCGKPISQSVEIKLISGERWKVNRALKAIDKVHCDGDLQYAKIVKGVLPDEWDMGYFPSSCMVMVRTGNIENYELMTLHEIGHMLDYQVYGHGHGYGSETGDEYLVDLLGAIKASDAYNILKDILEHGFLHGGAARNCRGIIDRKRVVCQKLCPVYCAS